MTAAVITSLAGLGTATICDPTQVFADTDYVAYVERRFPVYIWQQRDLPKFSIDPVYADRRNAKLAKVLGWLLSPGYDYYIWHDAHCELKHDPRQLVSDYLKDADLAIFKHPERSCSYAELAVLAQRNLDSGDNLMSALEFLQAESWPMDGGLFELSSFVYRPTAAVQKLMLTWFDLISKYTSRDQVLFPYALKTSQVRYRILPGSALPYGGNNQFFPSQRWKTQ